MSGVDLKTVQELLGHKDIKMTLRYSHIAKAHKTNAVEKLNITLYHNQGKKKLTKTYKPLKILMDGRGVEPPTSRVRFWRSPI